MLPVNAVVKIKDAYYANGNPVVGVVIGSYVEDLFHLFYIVNLIGPASTYGIKGIQGLSINKMVVHADNLELNTSPSISFGLQGFTTIHWQDFSESQK